MERGVQVTYPSFSRCSLSALETKSVMCTINGSKDIILTFEKSNASALVV